MDKQYSIEQIEAAANKLYTQPERTNPEDLIAELTKPKWTPQEGEVWCHKSDVDDREYYHKYNSGSLPDKYRPLTPSEVPGWERDKAGLKVAVEALEYIEPIASNYSGEYCSETLAKIKELTGD